MEKHVLDRRRGPGRRMESSSSSTFGIERDCSGIGSNSDCYEVPVYPDSDRDCDTDIDSSSGQDECRMMLWLNATMTISGINDPSDFTIAYNASNMSGG